jgi:predicted DNA-binding transcriptional regulator AlpA
MLVHATRRAAAVSSSADTPGADPGLNGLRALPPTVDVETAAEILGIGRTLAYQLAKTNQFPCRLLRLGRRYRVPTAELIRLLDSPPDPPATAGELPAPVSRRPPGPAPAWPTADVQPPPPPSPTAASKTILMPPRGGPCRPLLLPNCCQTINQTADRSHLHAADLHVWTEPDEAACEPPPAAPWGFQGARPPGQHDGRAGERCLRAGRPERVELRGLEPLTPTLPAPRPR